MKDKKHKPIFSPKYFVYDFAKVTAGIPGLIWHRPKLIYESKEAKKRVRGGALVISNHNGFADPIFVMYAIWYRRHRFVCLQKFLDSKIGWLFKRFGCIPIDKTNVGMDSFRKIVDCLKNDEIVSMFPEGSVNDGSGEMAAFKSGAVLMAAQSGKPIVPLYIKPQKHWYNRVQIVIGEKIGKPSEAMPSFKQIDDMTKSLYDKEKQLESILRSKK